MGVTKTGLRGVCFLPTRRFLPAMAVLAAVAVLPGLVWGDDNQHRQAEPITFVFENDLFSGQDRGYTNGAILTIFGGWQEVQAVEVAAQDRFTTWIDSLCRLDDPTRLRRRPLSFGQVMVTPEDLDRKEVVVNDLPYAGLLFGRVDYEYQTADQGEKFGLLLGVVGPSARAGEVQRIVHEIVSSDEPQGWDNQLHDEPAINIDYERMWKLYQAADGAYAVDLSGYLGLGLGNVRTEVGGGLIGRWGLNLSALPNAVYKGGISSVPDIGNDRRRAWSFFITAGMEVTYLAYSVFLDGNLWEESHSVTRVPEQAAAFAGFGLASRRFRLNMVMVRTTKIYTEQKGHGGYGSLTLGWIF